MGFYYTLAKERLLFRLKEVGLFTIDETELTDENFSDVRKTNKGMRCTCRACTNILKSAELGESFYGNRKMTINYKDRDKDNEERSINL